jgi:hypothetical protein
MHNTASAKATGFGWLSAASRSKAVFAKHLEAASIHRHAHNIKFETGQFTFGINHKTRPALRFISRWNWSR